MWLPAEPDDGVYVTEQLPLPFNVQVAELNAPAALLDQLIVPDGVDAVPAAVSVTVAVHVVAVPTATDGGLHTTAVDVDRAVAETEPVPELVSCNASPP